MTTTVTPAARPATGHTPGSRPRRTVRLSRAVLGRQPIGLLFGAPYALFVAVLFAYPLGLAVWMSFRRYYFTAPGVEVARPFVGLDNYRAVLTDPAVRRSFVNIGLFLVINVPLTVVLALLLATALNAAIPFRSFFRVSYYVPYVTASVAMVGVWLKLFGSGGLVNRILGSLAPDPSWLINAHWPAPRPSLCSSRGSSWGSSSCCTSPRCRTCTKELLTSPPRWTARTVMAAASGWSRSRASGRRPTLVTLLAIITGANLFTEPYLLTGGGGPDGASASPVLMMYQLGIEQDHPDVASAIGVLLVLVVLVVALLSRLLERDGHEHPAPTPRTAPPPAEPAGSAAGWGAVAPSRGRASRRWCPAGASAVHLPLLLHGVRVAAGPARTRT